MSEPKDASQYITLKEASRLSGYSPDYLGQLIRKGKLPGKQVYLNVAWMTTEEALRDYLEKNKPGGGKGDLGMNLRERFRRWAIAHTSGDQVISLARRVIYVLIAILIAFCLFLIYALGSNLFQVMQAHAAAGVPKILSYQGRLFNSSGNLLGGSGAQYCFRFSIYDAISGGSKLWPSTTSSAMTATVTNGVFNIGVGDVAAGGDALTYDFQATDTVYLDVAVATKVDPACTGGSEVFETLNPRERIVASGYAINSYSVGGFVPQQNASSNEIPVLNAGNLTLGGTNPQINATGTNTLTLQGGTGTGSVQFFSGNNFLSSVGALTLASSVKATVLQATATANQFLFWGNGATGTLSWTPTVSSTLTIPNFATGTDTVALVNFSQTLNGKTLNTPVLNSPTVNAGMAILQNASGNALVLTQNATGTALAVFNTPTSTQATSTAYILAGQNVSGPALFVQNFGSGNALQIDDSSSIVFTVNSAGLASFQPPVDTSTAFALKNASGTVTLLAADTVNNKIKIGPSAAAGSVPTLLGLDIKADQNDPTGFNGAMYYSSSTSAFRCYQNGWMNCVPTNLQWQPAFSTARWGEWILVGLAPSAFTAELNIPAVVVAGTAASSPQTEDNYAQWTTAATLNLVGGVTSTFVATEPRWLPRAATRIRTDVATTTRRIWFALNSAGLTGSDGTGTLATVYFGIRFSTLDSNKDWMCASGDGTTGSEIDTGVAVATTTYYDFILDASVLGQLTCSIATNGGSYVSVTKSTNIPTSTTALGITDAVTTLAASAAVHRSAYVYVESR